jgi:hypothetical protein
MNWILAIAIPVLAAVVTLLWFDICWSKPVSPRVSWTRIWAHHFKQVVRRG